MPVHVGYHCSHEQYAPGALLRHVRHAEDAGFACAMCSDHFHPWSEAEGESGFAWSWLGAALQATSLPFGVVTPPGGWRYHPPVLAQAAATLAEMFPGRFWMAVGSGERLNEHVVGAHWPEKAERNARLLEAVEVMRALWSGETVTHRGRITVEEAKLYSLPAEPPKVIGAALSPETAEWAGGWADGLITVVGEREGMREIVDAFRRGGGEGKPLYLQAQLSFGKDGRGGAGGGVAPVAGGDVPQPRARRAEDAAEFDAAGEYVRREDIAKKMRVSADPERYLEWLLGDLELGFEEMNLHCVNRGAQERFIDVFGERVLPELRRAG